VLLVGAGLLLKSFNAFETPALVFQQKMSWPCISASRSFVTRLLLQQTAFSEQLINGVRTIPGVDSAGLVSSAPGRGWGGDRLLSVAEHPPFAEGEGARSSGPRKPIPAISPLFQISVFISGRTFRQDERL